MQTLILSVLMCTSPVDSNVSPLECNTFEPYTWEVTQASIEHDYQECYTLATAYGSLRSVEAVDCFIQEEE